MDLNEGFPVSPAKLSELRQRIDRLGIDLRRVEEAFSRGGGKGGQKVNKTASRVTLRYPPLNLIVHCQRERRRSLNRFLALRELVDEIEGRLSPEASPRLKEYERLRRQKNRRRRRSLAANSPKNGQEPPQKNIIPADGNP